MAKDLPNTVKSWPQKAWTCPICGSENILMRNDKFPGKGKDGDVRRQNTIEFEGACLECLNSWDAIFIADRVENIMPLEKRDTNFNRTEFGRTNN
jgi:hypothetical protein